mmetsp:Transcript_67546/g.218294  ORF Transcript_67546/g.218294 Transcript_67546/m.218294 type:complete len:224 (+) Transcript_67546:193-864(+)
MSSSGSPMPGRATDCPAPFPAPRETIVKISCCKPFNCPFCETLPLPFPSLPMPPTATAATTRAWRKAASRARCSSAGPEGSRPKSRFNSRRFLSNSACPLNCAAAVSISTTPVASAKKPCLDNAGPCTVRKSLDRSSSPAVASKALPNRRSSPSSCRRKEGCEKPSLSSCCMAKNSSNVDALRGAARPIVPASASLASSSLILSQRSSKSSNMRQELLRATAN